MPITEFLTPVIVYQYQLMTHFLGCIVLVALTLALGVRPIYAHRHAAHAVIVTAILYIAAQIPVTLTRLHVTARPEFHLVNPIDVYINFAWSPMATVVLLWLYISHMVSSCENCEIAIPRSNIDPNLYLQKAAAAMIAGMFINYVICEHIVPIFGLDMLLVFRVLFGTAVALALLEIIYIRTQYNMVRLFNITWFTYTGTWFYLIVKAN